MAFLTDLILVIKTLLIRFWFIIIPLMVYFSWIIYKNSNYFKEEDIHTLRKSLFIKAGITTLLILLIWFFIHISSGIISKDESYIPNKINKGRLVPSKTIKKNDR